MPDLTYTPWSFHPTLAISWWLMPQKLDSTGAQIIFWTTQFNPYLYNEHSIYGLKYDYQGQYWFFPNSYYFGQCINRVESSTYLQKPLFLKSCKWFEFIFPSRNSIASATRWSLSRQTINSSFRSPWNDR